MGGAEPTLFLIPQLQGGSEPLNSDWLPNSAAVGPAPSWKIIPSQAQVEARLASDTGSVLMRKILSKRNRESVLLTVP